MSRAISYSLFGYDQTYTNCDEFASYFRYLSINVRMNKILLPGWETVLSVDEPTYNSKYKRVFDYLAQNGHIKLNVRPRKDLCEMMLWRMYPAFDMQYNHVICRDLDSLIVYREVQMIEEWIREDKTAHSITDSVSHNIPMMGGLCGFRPYYLRMRLGDSFDKLLHRRPHGFQHKGSDQQWLMNEVYPAVADSITEHFLKGMDWNKAEVNGRHYKVPEVPAADIPEDLKDKTNHMVNHCGQAGFAHEPVFKFLRDYENPLSEIENEFKTIFYWANAI